MDKFKTKYQFVPSVIDELQYIKRDNTESSYKDQNLNFKNPNYTASHIKAVSGSKCISIKANRLSGKNVNTEKKIYKKIEPDNKTSSIFGELHNIRHRRLFKKNGIIYDLIK